MSELATLTLTDFLLARIAEDEAVAGMEVARVLERHGPVALISEPWGGSVFDPARVLAECEAKRRIVAEMHGQPCTTCAGNDGEPLYGNHPCPTLRALALPYADHADFRAEWRDG